jgi:hypothetical protein
MLVAVTIGVAVAMQVHVTLPIGAAGLRASAADLVMPILAISLWIAARDAIPWPIFRTWSGWFIAPGVVLGVALVQGHATMAAWSSWAIVNKFGGWFALIAYAALGVWLASCDRRFTAMFLRALIVSAWIIAAAMLLILAFIPFLSADFFKIVVPERRAAGAFGNSNAFGFFVVVAIAMQLAFARHEVILRRRIDLAGLALLMSAVFASGSRSSAVALVVVITAHAIMRVVRWRELAIAGAITATLLTATEISSRSLEHVEGAVPHTHIRGTYYLDIVTAGTGKDSVAQRRGLTSTALDLWRQSPWTGIGLGVFLERQARGDTVIVKIEGENVPQVIHNSALWILVETGVVGLVVFSLLFIRISLEIYRNYTIEVKLTPGVIAALAAFVVVSLAMEAIYQRYLWFLLGLALGAAHAARRSNQSRTL